MSLWRLWWLTILLPALLAGALDYFRHRVLPGYLYRFPDPVNFAIVVLLGALIMTLVVSAYVQRHKARLLNTARDFATMWEDAFPNQGSVDPHAMAQRVLPRITS